MTIDEAIKILEWSVRGSKPKRDSDYTLSVKLGIEALKEKLARQKQVK
ncbi:hypothetical protein ES703_47223 [subsurface metagenome]